MSLAADWVGSGGGGLAAAPDQKAGDGGGGGQKTGADDRSIGDPSGGDDHQANRQAQSSGDEAGPHADDRTEQGDDVGQDAERTQHHAEGGDHDDGADAAQNPAQGLIGGFGGGEHLLGRGGAGADFAINSAVGCSLLCFIDSWTRKPLPWGQAAVEAAWLVFVGGAVLGLHFGSMPTAFDLASEVWSWFSLGLGVLVVARLVWHFATTDENRHIEAALLSICAVALMADAIGDKFGLLSGGYMIDAAPLLLLAFVATFVQRNFMLFQSAIGLSAMLESQLQAREAELVQAHSRERELASLQARAEERRRMMRDMHDGVGGQLVGLLLSVRRGNVDNQRIVDGLQGVMDEIRLMLDTDNSAGATLDAMLNIFETRVRPRIEDAGFTLNWTVDRSSSGDLAPQDVLQVFRIMQEAVTNAMKHSGGDQIEVTVSDQGGMLSVAVRDNGKGCGESGPVNSGGHGFGNMKDRAEAVGGSLSLSDAAPGTQVALVLPLRLFEEPIAA